MNWSLSSPFFNFFPIIFIMIVCIHFLHKSFSIFFIAIETDGGLVEGAVLDYNIDTHFSYLSFFVP